MRQAGIVRNFSLMLVLIGIAESVACAEESTPKGRVEAMLAAQEKGDVAELAKFFPAKLRKGFVKAVQIADAIATASKDLAAAVDEKFGEGTAEEIEIDTTLVSESAKGRGQCTVKEVREEGDKATVKYEVEREEEEPFEQTVTLVKEDGVWVMSPDDEGTKMVADLGKCADQLEVASKKVLPAIKALASDVSSGKITTTEDVATKYATALEPLEEALRGED